MGKFPGCIARKMIQHRLTNEKENSIILIPGMGIFIVPFFVKKREKRRKEMCYGKTRMLS